jgi:hypothetical protein
LRRAVVRARRNARAKAPRLDAVCCNAGSVESQDPRMTPLAPFVLALALTNVDADAQARIAPIVTAEQSFAADAGRLGVRLAFLSHFDAGSWLMRPAPVPAFDALARDPDDGTPLQWTPDVAGIAASGDFGFTSGPWSTRTPGLDGFVHGHYLTVWKRGADGVWRVQVDGGISHAALAKPTGAVHALATSAESKPLDAKSLETRRHALETADDALRHALADAKADRAATWHRFAAPDVRVLRSTQMPADGDGALALVTADPAQRGGGARRAFDVAASGDLAYSIGGDAACKPCGSDYRIWRWNDGAWRVAVDMETP